MTNLQQAATRAIAALNAAGVAGRDGGLCTAESLTAGLVASTLAEIPGVSAFLRGGVVAYTYDVKETLLGVDRELLESGGAVQEPVALAMARGAAASLKARWAIATTGVAGPGPSDGQPQGSVWIAVIDTSGDERTRELHLDGDRNEVRTKAATSAIEMFAELMEQNNQVAR